MQALRTEPSSEQARPAAQRACLACLPAGLIRPDWEAQFPNKSIVVESVVSIVVRKGNPLNIQGWDDLTRWACQGGDACRWLVPLGAGWWRLVIVERASWEKKGRLFLHT